MSQRVLVVIDMQNDFITGSLGTKEAQAIVEKVCWKIQDFEGEVLFTLDTHGPDYLETQEGRLLPVAHCIKGTPGWELEPRVKALCRTTPIEKPTFGSTGLADVLQAKYRHGGGLDEVVFVGLCTDICVVSNALLVKARLPEVPLTVDASCCAGVTPEAHQHALAVLRSCLVNVEE